MKISVVHGPNLQLLGRREPEIYGTSTLDDINRSLAALAGELDVELDTFQSNSEGELLDHVAESADRADGYVVNGGALTHTSIALHDVLVAVNRPFVEVHLSNTAAREEFRHHSFLTPVALGVVAGFGPLGYLLGLRALTAHLRDK